MRRTSGELQNGNIFPFGISWLIIYKVFARSRIWLSSVGKGKMTDRVLAVDIDGVVLDHAAGFYSWAQSMGIATDCLPENCSCYAFRPMFPGLDDYEINELLVSFSLSEEFGSLPVMPYFEEALAALRKDLGEFKLIAITAPGTSGVTVESRKRNLQRFDFDEVHVLEMGASKRRHLERLPKNAVYLDDLIAHVQTASALGLRSALFRQPHNASDTHHTVIRDWKSERELISNLLRVDPVQATG